ncbi:MAG: O-acetyl-ADP-ribose deacetylase [Kiritimatiellae bacterium]|nr:O-acetyl-ADP-ribose deacetylase [Kiritimatiellia bacterium]
MIKIIQGDITTLAVDAIVNAANQVMLGGGGVDGAIHDAAGPELYKACLKVPEVRPGVRCPTGEARITPGFKLPAKFVIHTVGPVYRDGQHGEPEKLAACYRNSLALAAENGCKSIAFPCISTGIYGYPIEDAAKIAVREVKDYLTQRCREAEVAESGQNGRYPPSGASRASGGYRGARSPVSPERSEPRKRSIEVCAPPQDRGAVAPRPPEMEVIFCCFSERDKAIYEAFLGGTNYVR